MASTTNSAAATAATATATSGATKPTNSTSTNDAAAAAACHFGQPAGDGAGYTPWRLRNYINGAFVDAIGTNTTSAAAATATSTTATAITGSAAAAAPAAAGVQGASNGSNGVAADAAVVEDKNPSTGVTHAVIPRSNGACARARGYPLLPFTHYGGLNAQAYVH